MNGPNKDDPFWGLCFILLEMKRDTVNHENIQETFLDDTIYPEEIRSEEQNAQTIFFKNTLSR